MPEYTDYAKIPIPLWEELDQVPPDLKNAFKVIDPKLILQATDAADRDAQYSDLPGVAIVVGTEQKAIWRRNSDGTWDTLWSKIGWTTVSMQSGFTAYQPLRYMVLNGICYWRGVLQQPGGYTGGEEVKICNVPAQAAPTVTYRAPVAGNSSNMATVSISGGSMTYYAGQGTTALWGVQFVYPTSAA